LIMETRNGLVYTLFAQEVGPMVKSRYPLVGKVQYNQILGRIWKGMPETERAKYQKKADNMNLAQDITHQIVEKPDIPEQQQVITQDIPKQKVTEPQGPTLTTKIVPAINNPNIKSTGHAVNNSNQRAFTAFSAAVRPNLERQNPRMKNEQITEMLEQNWNQLGEEERYKYSRVSKRGFGDYFGKFKEVEMYKNNKNQEKEVNQEREVIDLESEAKDGTVIETVHTQNSEADDIRIIKDNGTHSSPLKEVHKENLEVLYPGISISQPQSGSTAECGGCQGLEREVSGLKRDLGEKTEVIAKLVKRIRYLEDVTGYKY